MRNVCAVLAALISISLASQDGALRLTTLDYHRLAGSYTDLETARGLRFVSEHERVYIETLAGEPLLAASETVGSFRLVSIGAANFVQYEGSRDYAVPFFVNSKDFWNFPWKFEALAKSLRASGEDGQRDEHAVKMAIENVLSLYETSLVERTALALSDAGVRGFRHPSAQPFFLAAMQLQHMLVNNTAVQRFSATHAQRVHGDPDDDCTKDCPPCEEEECLGMCGPGCVCWSFVCGDCCWHLGCYGHDVCCRDRFSSTKCLFPFNFKCESEYTC